MAADEELRSAKEERSTFNDQLGNRNQEFDQVAGDLVNVLGSVEIPVIIVDLELRIRRFTPTVKDIANFIPETEGSRDRARSIVETVTAALVVLDSGLCVVSADKAFCEMCALSPGNAEGRNLRVQFLSAAVRQLVCGLRQECPNGCEIDTSTNTSHCGACGHGCSSAHGSAQCSAGVCKLASCSAEFADCNAVPSDGCETDTQTDVTHCGCAMAWHALLRHAIACPYEPPIRACSILMHAAVGLTPHHAGV